MNLLLWIIFGALVGWIASKIMHTDEEQGALLNIVVGIIGAILGGYLFRLLGGEGVTGFNIGSFIVALIGAVILIGIVKTFSRSIR
jgi:uncharacterized membrane protein YeaQ/YmgE (transglycosylase-associated protein family)